MLWRYLMKSYHLVKTDYLKKLTPILPKWGRFHKFNPQAGVAELADAADLKSAGAILVGSSPTPGTR